MLHKPVFVDVVQAADAEKVLAARGIARRPELIGQVDRFAADGQLVGDRASPAPAVDRHRAVLRLQNPAHDTEQRRLAHAIRADNHHQLAAFDA